MSKKEITENLESLGLSKNEVEIYLGGLRLGPTGVAELQKHTNIKRPTIYHCLNTLSEKGLVSKTGTQTKLQFSFSSPQKLKKVAQDIISSLNEKLSDLDKIIPELQGHLPVSPKKTRVEHYEGKEGVKMVVEEALYCAKRKWDIIAPEKNFFSDFDKKFAKYYMDTRKLRGIKTRSLWEKNPTRRILTDEEIEQRQPKFLPEAMKGKFKSVMILFDNKVAIINSTRELSAVLITSDELHEFFKALFEGLWSASQPYDFKK